MIRYLVRGLLLSLLTASFAGVHAQVPAADSVALVALWNATGGPNWAMNSRPTSTAWLSQTPEGEPIWVGQWTGVIVRDNRVSTIALFRENLVGQLPPGLAGLTSPVNIGIHFNSGENGNLHGPIPESFGTMKTLEQLVLTGNMLTGGIPDTLAGLPKLRSLSLTANPLGGPIPASLGRLSNLENLALSTAELVGEIPADLGNLTRLEDLRLDNNNLEGSIPSSLGQIPALRVLWLQSNDLTGILPASIGGLSNLTSLRLDVNMLEGPIPASWGGLSSVRQLWVGLNKLSGQLPEELGNLSSLEFLTLALNEFSGPVPESFTRLTALKNLNIHENDFESMPDLSALPNLEQLRVYGNRLTFEHLEPMAGLLSNPRITTFHYAPQDSVDLEVSASGGEVTLSMPVGGERTEYRWYRDDVEMEDATDDFYTIPTGETGTYRAVATNDLLPDLTLYSRPIGNVLVVNSIGDTPLRTGAVPGFCDTGVELIGDDAQPVPECTLRAAIESINAITPAKASGPRGTVVLLIDLLGSDGPGTIILGEPLDPIASPVVIDAATHAAGTILNGSDHAVDVAFKIRGAGSRILGFDIDGFSKRGIEVDADDVTVEHCVVKGSETGILVRGDRAKIVDNRTSRNSVGIELRNSNGSRIERNKIGTDAEGEAAIPNSTGIGLLGGTGNTFRENLVSGNDVAIQIRKVSGSKTEQNRFESNLIGTTADGNRALDPRSDSDVPAAIFDAGDRSVFRYNTISGNVSSGILLQGDGAQLISNRIGTNEDGTAALGNKGTGIALVGGSALISDNVISDNRNGILVASSSARMTIDGNRIGTDIRGQSDFPNRELGVLIRSVGELEMRQNTISANRWGGLHLSCTKKASIVSNTILGNGLGASQGDPQGNGVTIEECRSASLDNNVVSANEGYGIVIADSKVSMANNKIGTDETGLIALGNKLDGVVVGFDSKLNAKNNVISANGRRGVFVDRASRVSLRTNHIGTNEKGGNPSLDMGNGGAGFHAFRSSAVLLFGNRISNHTEPGVLSEEAIGSLELGGNTITENVVGVRIVKGSRTVINGNTICDNDRNIDIQDTDEAQIDNSDVCGGTGSNTGLHLTRSNALVTGSNFEGDAGDAITLEQGSTARINGNNFRDNQQFGINNLDASVVVDASGNWWGEPSGPAGAGPGAGDAVSDNVDFTSWREDPVGIVLSARDGHSLLVGEPDTISVYANNWTKRDDVLSLHVSDDQGWLQGGPEYRISLVDSVPGIIRVESFVPAGTEDGSHSNVTVIATSEGDAAQADTLIFSIVAQSAMVIDISVFPDSVAVLPGDTVEFEVLGLDELGRDIRVSAFWSSSGGTIDDEGTFVAPHQSGDYTVTATHPGSQLTAIGVVSVISGVSTEQDEIPIRFALEPNYPNPFNPATTIEYSTPKTVHASLVVYDMLGRQVAKLVDEVLAPGAYKAQFDASRLVSGLYFYRLSADDFVETRKMILLK